MGCVLRGEQVLVEKAEFMAVMEDIRDFAAGEIRLRRAVVHQHVGDLKTEASQKPVPMDGALIDALQDWSRQAPYRQMGDWVFASPNMDGKQPYWPETPIKCYLHPAAKRVGITKAIGWHSFCRTFATLLKGGGEDVKTVQELMRHAGSRLTLDVFLTGDRGTWIARLSWAHSPRLQPFHPFLLTANVPNKSGNLLSLRR